MDQVTISRELLLRAIDTISYYASVCGEDDQDTPAKQTQAALRAALEAEPAPVQESVVWGVDWGSHGDRSCVSIIKKHADGVHEIVATEYGPVGLTQQPQLLTFNDREELFIKAEALMSTSLNMSWRHALVTVTEQAVLRNNKVLI